MNQVQKTIDCSGCGKRFDAYLDGLIEVNTFYKSTCPHCSEDNLVTFPYPGFLSPDSAKGVMLKRVDDL